VPKLAGLIAYRRRELDVSRGKFEVARKRNTNDCETAYYLGVILAEQRLWPRTAEVLLEAGQCIENAERGYTEEIAKIRASNDPPERQAKKIARREQYIAKGRRMQATSWFDIAVAYYNLSRREEARQFAKRWPATNSSASAQKKFSPVWRKAHSLGPALSPQPSAQSDPPVYWEDVFVSRKAFFAVRQG